MMLLFLGWFCGIWMLLIGITILILMIDQESSDPFIGLFPSANIFAFCLLFCTPIALTVLIISKLHCRKKIKKRKPVYPKPRDVFWDDFRDKIDDRMGYHPDFKDKVKDRMEQK